MKILFSWAVTLRFLLIAGCAMSFAGAENAPSPSPDLPPTVHRLEAPGIQNLFALGTNIFSGSAPEGDAGFQSLVKLGIKTIFTVDGSAPDVALAHRYGFRYVHIPHGYDGVGAKAQAALAKAAESVPGPIFVHCHHGMHRGPVAAAVICMADYGWTPAQGEAWLHTAGTGTNYVGLYESVRKFQEPSAELMRATPNVFPEVAKVSGLVETMVSVDERWDHLKAIRKAGYKTPAESPDIQPAHEALILSEHFREAQRLPEAATRGKEFLTRLGGVETTAHESERLLRIYLSQPTAETRAQLDKTFDALGRACASCHQANRDLMQVRR